MSSKHKKLGSLADIYQAEHLDGSITKIPIDQIHPSTEQPRQDRRVAVEELAASLKKDGLLSPIVVTKDGAGYRIIAGERRYHAARELNWGDIECRIVSRKEMDYWRISVIENLQRENLSAEEEAIALLKLKSADNLSDADLAALVGKSRNYVTEILGIASLPNELLRRCKSSGMDNKNLLIQVVQAYRRGGAEKLIDAYRSGAIRTVRELRDFIQKTSPQISSKTSNKESSPSSPRFDMKISGKTVKISCPSNEEANKIKEWLKNNHPAFRDTRT